MSDNSSGLWSVIRGATSAQIRRQMEQPISVLLVGDPQDIHILSDRLGSPTAQHQASGSPILQSKEIVVFDASRLCSLNEADFAKELSAIVAEHSDILIALARAVPAMRPIIVNQLSHDRSVENAKIAALSALPGIIPLTDWLLPLTSAGDMLVLTRNQITLLLEVAACYGRPPETMARIKELLPIVGSAFGWRAVARELAGLVPGGIGLVIKATIAYAGTFSVGRAAAFYYSGASVRLSVQQLRTYYRGALLDGYTRARAFIGRS